MIEDKNIEKPISSLHTLEGDLLSSMKDENYASNIVKIVTHQANEGGNKSKIYNQSNNQSSGGYRNIYIYLGLILIIGISIGIYYTTQKTNNKTEEEEKVTTNNTSTDIRSSLGTEDIISAEISMPVDISTSTRNQLIDKINQSKQNLIEHKVADEVSISFITNTSLQDFFNKIQYSGSETLLHSFSKEQYYSIGLYHIKDDQFETYFIANISIFDLAFAGMLEWERNMPIDLKNLYIHNSIREDNTYIDGQLANKFKDKVIKNIDTRVYVDPKNNIEIIYGIIDKKYLLITSGENSFADIVNKLLIKNVLR